MKAVSYLFVGLLTLQVYGLAPASAKTLSGEYRLDNKNILISETQKYRGQFDLRSKLPLGDDFVLTKIIISFKFQDDKEWIQTTGRSIVNDTGKITRHGRISAGAEPSATHIVGQTDHYFESLKIVNMTNEMEVAELTIGRNKFFGATIPRRDVTEQSMGRRKVMVGIYEDPGDENRNRRHFRITDTVLKTQRIGYDGLFEIRGKILDLASTQDLAHTGLLDFEISAQGDFIFVSANLKLMMILFLPKLSSVSSFRMIRSGFRQPDDPS